MRSLQQDGFAWTTLKATSEDLAACFDGNSRNALELAVVRSLVERLRPTIAESMGCAPVCVRGILFDKTAAANWHVAWHQDRTIALAERVDVSGYGPWSTKAGVVHVQPPAPVLASMLTARLHLDPTPATNGALRVIPGSHSASVLDDAEIAEQTRGDAVTCSAEPGDVLLMRPLLLHASSKSTEVGRRRVVHLEFAQPDVLDSELAWRWAV